MFTLYAHQTTKWNIFYWWKVSNTVWHQNSAKRRRITEKKDSRKLWHGNTRSFTCSVSIFYWFIHITFKDCRALVWWKIQTENHINTFSVIRSSVFVDVCIFFLLLLLFPILNWCTLFHCYCIYIVYSHVCVCMIARLILYSRTRKFPENIFMCHKNSITTLSPLFPLYFVTCFCRFLFFIIVPVQLPTIFFSIWKFIDGFANEWKKKRIKSTSNRFFFLFYK